MQILMVLHSLVRWFILLFGIWTVFSAISGLMSKRNFTNSDDKANLLFMIMMDVQLLIGLVLYFGGVWFDRLKHLGQNMKDPMLRFFTLEHGILMIIAWILVHAGRIAVKRSLTPRSKFKKALIYFGIALLFILIAIPWPFREAGVGRMWFRWF
ncbi:MAG: hypothetical protein ABIR31_02250 [Ginsengibacter sp.]